MTLVEVALLNSSVGHFIMNKISPAIQNGYRRYFSQYVEIMPLPIIISDTLRSQLANVDATSPEELIDELAFAAYRLNPSQQRAIVEFRQDAVFVEGNDKSDQVLMDERE